MTEQRPDGDSPRLPLLTAEQAAEQLSVPSSWMYRSAKEGIFPSVKVGRYVRFRQQDVDEWVASGGRGDDQGLEGAVTEPRHGHCKRCGLPAILVSVTPSEGMAFHIAADGSGDHLRGCWAASFTDDRGKDESLNPRWTCSFVDELPG